MPKLTKQQREELNQLVREGIVHHFSINEIQQMIQTKLNLQLSIDYLNHVKCNVRRETKQHLEYLQRDRYAYLSELFFDRIGELKSLMKTLNSIIDTNEDDEIRIKAIDKLQSVISQVAEYYAQLPGLTNPATNAFSDIVAVSDNNNNNITTTTTTLEGRVDGGGGKDFKNDPAYSV